MWLLFACLAGGCEGAVGGDGGTPDGGALDGGAPDGGAPGGGAGDGGGGAPTPTEREALLQLLVDFYAAQRCGDADNWLFAAHELGPSCHLQDGPDAGPDVDLVGGWHDAGDHIKVSSTTAWTVYVMAMVMELRPDALVEIEAELGIGADWLMRIRLDDERLVHLVGGPEDHATFVTAPFQSTLPRGMGGGIRAVHVDGKGDVAFLAAAALARAARVTTDPSRAASYLAEAQALWGFGEAWPGATDNVFYQDASWEEERWCAAVELTASAGAGDWSEALSAVPGARWWGAGWWDPTDLCRHTAARAGLEYGRSAWEATLADLQAQVSHEAPVDGLVWLWDWGSLPAAAGAALSAALLADLAGDEEAARLAETQLAWILGENPYARSFVIGLGQDPPRRPHHASAYGYDELETDWTHEPRFVLAGALVGGPTVEAFETTTVGYEDDVEDYIGNEVTLDYNANLLGLVALRLDPVGPGRPAR